jgi:O-methyltransferase
MRLDLSFVPTAKLPWVQTLKALTPPFLWQFAYRHLVARDIDGADRYRSTYTPWMEPEHRERYAVVRPHTLVAPDRCYYLTKVARQAVHLDGDFVEAGSYRGGTALLLKLELERAKSSKVFHIMDSFEGMKAVSTGADRHRVGDLSDTSLEGVQAVVGTGPNLDYRKGWIPETFKGLEDRRFAFAHIDLDLYQSILDACTFVYPRMVPGGAMVFDDYGFPNNPGARRAVDEFFRDLPEEPIVLPSGQAVVLRSAK